MITKAPSKATATDGTGPFMTEYMQQHAPRRLSADASLDSLYAPAELTLTGPRPPLTGHSAATSVRGHGRFTRKGTFAHRVYVPPHNGDVQRNKRLREDSGVWLPKAYTHQAYTVASEQGFKHTHSHSDARTHTPKQTPLPLCPRMHAQTRTHTHTHVRHKTQTHSRATRGHTLTHPDL